MGKAEDTGVCTEIATRTSAPNKPVVASQSRYEEYMREKLKVFYLQDDVEARKVADFVKSINPSAVALDLETTSKNGQLGALSGAVNGSIRLIQLGFKEGDKEFQVVIDCHEVNPAPFLPLLRSNKVEKQIHYMDFEQSWAVMHLGVEIKNIFDTCMAYKEIDKRLYEIVTEKGLQAGRDAIDDPKWTPKKRLYNDKPLDKVARAAMEKVGVPEAQKLIPHWEPGRNAKLSQLAENYQGIILPKENQVSDWGRGNLDASQIIYAAMDVAILPDVTEPVRQDIIKLGLEKELAQKVAEKTKNIKARAAKHHKENGDDLDRVVRALKRAPTKKDLDDILKSSAQMTLTAESRKMTKQVAKELRSNLQN